MKKKQSIIYEIGCSKLEKVGFDEKKKEYFMGSWIFIQEWSALEKMKQILKNYVQDILYLI